MSRPACCLALVLAAVLAHPARAQQPAAPALKRTILAQHTRRDGVQAFVELAPGGVAARHTHAGEEMGYFIEGSGVIEIAGQPPLEIKAGEAFFIPANTPHLVRNTGSVTIRLAAVYVVETGKPLATPAP
ncbi:MAG: cupin domain-containing protein [Gemmatimonadetes bacterium]|nr:cupin domain-containing protein [Gemmatimonadota bacterium]